MSTFNNRVKAQRLKLGLTQARLAKLAGIPQSTIGQIENGRNKSSTKLVELASALQTTPEYLTHGIVNTNSELTISLKNNETILGNEIPLSDEDYVFLPFYKNVSFVDGNTLFSLDAPNGLRLPFSTMILKENNVQPEQAIFLMTRGNSMDPVLPDKSIITVDMGNKHIIDGKIYAINQGGLLRIKRLYALPNNKVRLNSYNQDEHSDEVTLLDDIDLIGRVFNWSVTDT